MSIPECHQCSFNIQDEGTCRDAELILLIKPPFEFSQLARITVTAAQATPQRAPIGATEQEQLSKRVQANAIWPAKATAHLINEAQPGGPCIAWADELTPSQCLLICPKTVVGKVYKALKTRERDYQCKLQDVKSSIQLKDLRADHLQRGMSAWMSRLLVKAGWAQLTSQSYLKPYFLAQNATGQSLCRLQPQLELRSPHNILLRLNAGKPQQCARRDTFRSLSCLISTNACSTIHPCAALPPHDFHCIHQPVPDAAQVSSSPEDSA